MSLYSLPPDFISVNGVNYEIETDFRFWANFQGILLGHETNGEKARKICDLMKKIGLPETKESLDAMLQFYAGASTENQTKSGGNVQAYDLEKDSEYIFSAFMDSYGIDLTTERLHWWRFKALFKSLPEDCQMCKIMMYRTIDLKKVPKEQKNFYREMKERYSLKSENHNGYRTEQEMKDYVKKRFAEAQIRMPKMRSDQQPSVD